MKGEPRWHWSIPVVWAGLGTAWYWGLLARGSLPLHCVQTPGACEPQGVNGLDRWVLSYTHNPFLDSVSFVTQDLSGALFLLTTAWLAWRGGTGRRLIRLGKYWAMGFTATLLNGVCTELARHIGQRPRPFVYLSSEQGLNPQNYVSFYSGHTSFAATSCTLTVLFVWWTGSSLRLKQFSTAAAVALTLSTGMFRVLSGRHFVTDVVAGAIAGACVAWGVFALATATGRPKPLRH